MINTKEQTVLKSIKDAFEGEDMQTQYSVLSYRIDLYFHKYKLAIEVDELGHADRNLSNEIERQKVLEKELDCVFIPELILMEKNFNLFKEINKILRYIKKSTKKSLMDDLSKRLLELEIKSNHSIESKCLKWIAKKKKNTTYLIKLVGKICYQESRGTAFKAYVKKQDTHCLTCRKRTDNKLITPKQVVNKLNAQKSICADCGSKKSVFVK